MANLCVFSFLCVLGAAQAAVYNDHVHKETTGLLHEDAPLKPAAVIVQQQPVTVQVAAQQPHEGKQQPQIIIIQPPPIIIHQPAGAKQPIVVQQPAVAQQPIAARKPIAAQKNKLAQKIPSEQKPVLQVSRTAKAPIVPDRAKPKYTPRKTPPVLKVSRNAKETRRKRTLAEEHKPKYLKGKARKFDEKTVTGEEVKPKVVAKKLKQTFNAAAQKLGVKATKDAAKVVSKKKLKAVVPTSKANAPAPTNKGKVTGVVEKVAPNAKLKKTTSLGAKHAMHKDTAGLSNSHSAAAPKKAGEPAAETNVLEDDYANYPPPLVVDNHATNVAPVNKPLQSDKHATDKETSALSKSHSSEGSKTTGQQMQETETLEDEYSNYPPPLTGGDHHVPQRSAGKKEHKHIEINKEQEKDIVELTGNLRKTAKLKREKAPSMESESLQARDWYAKGDASNSWYGL